MSKRTRRLKGEIGAFVQQYARKHYPNHDPNDRRYFREVEKIVRRMRPEDLDALMHDDPDEASEQPDKRLEPRPSGPNNSWEAPRRGPRD